MQNSLHKFSFKISRFLNLIPAIAHLNKSKLMQEETCVFVNTLVGGTSCAKSLVWYTYDHILILSINGDKHLTKGSLFSD